MTAGAAIQKFMMAIEKEQEVLMHIADMAIETYNAESALLRLMKLEILFIPEIPLTRVKNI